MSSSVFLATCDATNFDRTVVSSVDLEDHSNVPDELSDAASVRIWGVPAESRNVDFFEKLETGDLVLFHENGTFVGSGRIGSAFADDSELADELWEDSRFELLFTVEDFNSVSVPKSAVNRIFGYSDGYTPPQGLIRVSDRKVDNRPEVIEQALIQYTEQNT